MPRTRMYITLDVMRGVAAIAVLAHHCAPMLGPKLSPGSAYLAVDLFFILSGFVLALAYSDRLQTSLSAREFIRVRIIRIYPLFALGMIFGVGAALLMMIAASPGWTLTQVVRDACTSLVMLPSIPWDGTGPTKNNLFTLNGPAWSLFFEIAVNLVFAFLPVSRFRSILPIVIIGGLGVIATIICYGHLDVGAHYFEAASGVARVAFGFFVGVLIFSVYRNSKPRWVPPASVVVGITAGLLIFPAWAEFRPWYDATCALLLFPMLIYFAAYVQPYGIVKRVGETLGAGSYALYATHTGPLLIFGGVLSRLFPSAKGQPVPVAGVAFMIGMILFALALQRYFDTPFRGWINAKFPRSGIKVEDLTVHGIEREHDAQA